MSQALVAFYQGTSPDSRGRSLVDLWALDHEAMECRTILESLRLLGLESYSVSLYSCLEAIRN